MQITDENEFRQELFEHYVPYYEGVHDPKLIDEALALLANHFSYTDEKAVMGSDRFHAVSYLALKVAKELLSKEEH